MVAPDERLACIEKIFVQTAGFGEGKEFGYNRVPMNLAACSILLSNKDVEDKHNAMQYYYQ